MNKMTFFAKPASIRSHAGLRNNVFMSELLSCADNLRRRMLEIEALREEVAEAERSYQMRVDRRRPPLTKNVS
jgi:hypothetical protein